MILIVHMFYCYLQWNWQVLRSLKEVFVVCLVEQLWVLKLQSHGSSQLPIIFIRGLTCSWPCASMAITGSYMDGSLSLIIQLKGTSFWTVAMKHSGTHVLIYPEISSSTYKDWGLLENPRRSLRSFLINKMRFGDTFWRMSWYLYIPVVLILLTIPY